MSYLLDTNVCIAFLNGQPDVNRRLLSLPRDSAAISSLTEAELLFGAERSGRVEENRLRVATFVGELRVISFDREIARCFGLMKARLMDAGRPIPDFDIGIASTAQSLGLVLVSADRHMREIADVVVEDWTAA